MAHCSKPDRCTAPAARKLSPTGELCPGAGGLPPCAQPSMRRYIHPIAPIEPAEQRESDRLSMAKALEEQNRLLTDLLAAVNGLTALLCGRGGL